MKIVQKEVYGSKKEKINITSKNIIGDSDGNNVLKGQSNCYMYGSKPFETRNNYIIQDQYCCVSSLLDAHVLMEFMQ